jgi:hypothetical protein
MSIRAWKIDSLRRLFGSVTPLAMAAMAATTAACTTVRPAQRALLSDPIMQFEGDPQASAQFRHAIDNREGSYGGGGVSGGGCGCN